MCLYLQSAQATRAADCPKLARVSENTTSQGRKAQMLTVLGEKRVRRFLGGVVIRCSGGRRGLLPGESEQSNFSNQGTVHLIV